MNRRQFVLPAVSVLGLAVTTTACDAVIGTWNATSLTSYGQTTTLPYSYSYTDTGSGTTYTYTQSLQLVVDKQMNGHLVSATTKDGGAGPADVFSASYGAVVTPMSKGVYDVSIDIGIDLSCTVAKKDMSCDNTDTGTPLSIAFTK